MPHRINDVRTHFTKGPRFMKYYALILHENDVWFAVIRHFVITPFFYTLYPFIRHTLMPG